MKNFLRNLLQSNTSKNVPKEQSKFLSSSDKVELALTLEGVTTFQINLLKELWGSEYLKEHGNEILKRLEMYKYPINNLDSESKRYIFDKYLGGDLKVVHNLRDKKEEISELIRERKANNEKYTEEIGSKYGLNEIEAIRISQLIEDKGIWDALPVIEKELNNQIVVDLFAGPTSVAFDIETIVTPHRTILVDKYSSNEGDIPVKKVLLHQDALQFLALIPDNSVNLSMNGVDVHIFNRTDKPGITYLNGLKNEIARTLKNDGIFIASYNDFAEELSEGMVKIYQGQIEEHKIFQKKSS